MLKQFILSFVFINFLVYAISYLRGAKAILSPYYMTYKYGIKWLTLGMAFAVCYLLWDKYGLIYWRSFNIKTKYIITLFFQTFFVLAYILLFCCNAYPRIDITDKMIPSEYTYMDDNGTWYINDNNDYKAKDIILSGPYLPMEKGAYTIIVDYESNYTQYMLVQSEENSSDLEAEYGRFLGGGEQTRKTYIRVNGKLDDLDIQIVYSGKGDIRIRHIWIEENNSLFIEYIVIIAVLFLVWDIWKYIYDIRKVQCPSKQLVRVLGNSFLSTMAIAATGNVIRDGNFFYLIRNEFDGAGIAYLFVGIVIFFLYKRFLVYKVEYSSVVNILAGILSFCMVIGISMSSNGDLRFIYNSPLQFIVCIMTSAGYYILFRVCLAYIYRKLDTMQLNIELKIYKEHTFGITLGILSAMWLPIWICFWPASVTWDGMSQLNMGLGFEKFTNHHPWLSTMLMKFFFEIGRLVNDNMGVFLVALFNIVLELTIYSYVCYKVRENAGDILYIVSVFLYGINPEFSMYGQMILKDGLFVAVFTLFVAYYMDCVLKSKRERKIGGKNLFVLAVIGIVICALRRNGVYVVLPSYICLLLVEESRRKKLQVLLLGCLIACSFIMIDRIIPDKLGIEQGSSREALSIPFQQTARYFRDYGDEISAYEYEVVDKVLDAENLKEYYQPEISDNVKATYKGGLKNEGLSDYFRVWVEMFQKHPINYLEATLHNSYGYYYPFKRYAEMGNLRINYRNMTGDIDAHYIFSYEVRNKVEEYIYAFQSLPIFSLLFNPGFYTWFIFVAIGYDVLYKRYKNLIIYVAPCMNILVCIASPVNALMRYALPQVAVVPILICWSCIRRQPVQNLEEISMVDPHSIV